MIMHADVGGIIILMCIFTAGMTLGAYLQDRIGKQYGEDEPNESHDQRSDG